jgi:GTP cyclohydrolase I
MNKAKVRDGVKMSLEGLGEDISCEGLVDTPRRVAEMLERMAVRIADAISNNVENRGVFVPVDAHHMCIGTRGVCQPDCSTITQARTGEFSSNFALVNHVQQLILAKNA